MPKLMSVAIMLGLLLSGCVVPNSRPVYYPIPVESYPSTYQLYMDNYRIQQEQRARRQGAIQHNIPLGMCRDTWFYGCPSN